MTAGCPCTTALGGTSRVTTAPGSTRARADAHAGGDERALADPHARFDDCVFGHAGQGTDVHVGAGQLAQHHR